MDNRNTSYMKLLGSISVAVKKELRILPLHKAEDWQVCLNSKVKI